MQFEMNLPKVKGLFVTGTDTGVGKTLIAGGIASVLQKQGHKIGVFKPVASGCVNQYEGLVNADSEFLRKCSHCDFNLSVINPVGFVLPAAPSVCEEHEGRMVDFNAMAEAYRTITAESDIMIVEGIGGVRVPISNIGVDVLDLATQFGLPVVIVTRPDLGTINHTLLTIDAVRGSGLEIAGVVISGYKAMDASIAEETLHDVLEQWGEVPVLSIVPFDEEADVEGNRLGEVIPEAFEDVDWMSLTGF